MASRDDIKYEQNTIDKTRRAVVDRLNKGTPVRVGTAHHFATSMLQGGALQPNLGGGHFNLIVGCNEASDRFLYVDPWFGGSQLQYGGGITAFNPATNMCQFLGLFVLQTTSTRGPVLIQDASTAGSFTGPTLLEIIAGPL